jgi:hypothetical protein
VDRAVTTAPAPSVCPPSAVVDQIIPWEELRGGDLVLYKGDLIVAEKVSRTQGLTSFAAILPLDREVQIYQLSDYVAVRRYVEG